MKITKNIFGSILVLSPKRYKDDRGSFKETFRKNTYKDLGITDDFIQENQSLSFKNTIRGLHYQINPFAQGKLVSVVYGKILDVVVDIRFGSPTFGNYHSIELSLDNNTMLWIPEGFAHGFSVLSDYAIVLYKLSSYYSKEHERGILFSDEKLNIDWMVTNPILSEKDKVHTTIDNIGKDFYYYV